MKTIRGVRKVNPKRRKAEFARCYHSKERVEFVKSLPCAGCGRVGFSENAHTESGGAGMKAGYETIAALCGYTRFDFYPNIGCHMKYDQHLPPFDTEEARDRIKAAAVETQKRWLEFSGESE